MVRFLSYALLVLIVLGVGFYLYQRNIAPVPLTAADLDKGGAFSDDEKNALKTACAAFIKKDTDKVCGCINDKAATDISRFDRLELTTAFQGKISEIIALTKGLVDSGIPQDKAQAAAEQAKQHIVDIEKACGAT